MPDLESLRERLRDRPDLFDASHTLQFVGQQMQDREQWLTRLLKRFADMKADAEAKKAKDLLAGASDEETIELLKRIQQAQSARASATQTTRATKPNRPSRRRDRPGTVHQVSHHAFQNHPPRRPRRPRADDQWEGFGWTGRTTRSSRP